MEFELLKLGIVEIGPNGVRKFNQHQNSNNNKIVKGKKKMLTYSIFGNLQNYLFNNNKNHNIHKKELNEYLKI